MAKLILNFKSKDSKKIKNPKNYLGGKGANIVKKIVIFPVLNLQQEHCGLCCR